jgi:hypothetical protein
VKYYRVKKDTFIWKDGAVLKEGNYSGSSTSGYRAIEDIWDATPTIGTEYISARIVEHPDNSEFFERVYQDTIGGKVFKTKDQIVQLYNDSFKT